MKKGNILIAVIAVLAAASVVKAEEIKMDFDGGRVSDVKTHVFDLLANGENELALPAAALEVSRYDEQNAFWKDSKCMQGSCVEGHSGYYCNLSTCGKTLPAKVATEKRSVGPDMKKIAGDLSELGLLKGLTEKQLKDFFSSLMFRGDVFIGANVEDIDALSGKAGVERLLEYFLPAAPEKSLIDKPYIKDAKCIAPGTCSGNFPGYVCPESC